ncbi:MAG: hypothetical protein JWR63_360 [Conexibacter sp.]|nr:hypothetical protein [Conexibacter sp.]
MGPSSPTARRGALAVALVAFVLVSGAGLLTRHDKPLAVATGKAVRLSASALAPTHALRPGDVPQVLYVDDSLVKVMWYRHGRAVATSGVRADTGVMHQGAVTDRAGWGAPLSHAPIVLGALAILFLLATLRLPLRRMRTLDVLALSALLAPAVLIDHGRFGPAEGLMAALLLYLGARGAWLAMRGPDPADDPEAPVLLTVAAARARLPRLAPQVALTLLAATVMVVVTSTGIVDIAVANMEGATVLAHGRLPYGHMPGDIVHGDTYGLPIYALYAPFAAIWPMTSDWDDPIGSLVLNAIVLLACVAGAGAATRGARWPAIVALLAFPAALMGSSSGTNDVLIAAALLWAFAWWTRPAASSALVMLAGLAKLAPIVLLPLWLARLRGAELRRALIASAAVGLAVLIGLVAVGGLHGPASMVEALAFQFSRRSELSIWTALRLQPLQPFAQGLTLAIVAGGTVLVWLDRAVAADPRRVAGLVSAVLAGLQVSANHWAPLYLLWFAPPVMIALLGPLGAPAPATAPAPVPASGTASAATRFAPV